MHITGRFIAALTVLTLGTACSGDSVTETSGDTLSEQEVLEIFTALSAVGGGVMPLGPVAAPANGPQLADIPIDESLDDTADCPNGGTLSIRGNVSGTVDDVTFDADLEFDLTQDMTDCGITTASNAQFVLNGADDIDIVGTILMSGESVSGSLAYQGGFAWEAEDGRSGTCGVDFDVSFSSASLTGTASGEICDRTVTFTQ
jgi:hypothetical protein